MPIRLPSFKLTRATGYGFVERVSKRNERHGNMAVAFHHYRATSIGQELSETLQEFVDSGLFNEDQKRSIMELFDRAISNALSTWVRSRATIKGPLHHYRNHDDIWTFFLDQIELKLDGSSIRSPEKTKIISVTRR